MANEFIIKNGYRSQGNSEITGSLEVTAGITGSLQGTASFAITASYVENAQTASYVLNAVSSSYAATASFITSSNVFGPYGSDSIVSSSYAVTASYATFAETASSALNAQDILIYVLNNSGYDIAKGTVVHITASGNSSDIPRIITASYENDANSANTLGITNEAITNGSLGYVMTEGVLKDIDTSNFTSGQLIYLGATGSIIGTAPQAPLHGVRLGQVVREQSNNGSIYVRIDNGYELEELHDVLIISASSGDLVMRSGSVWVNTSQLSGSYGLTGSLAVNNGTNEVLNTSLTQLNHLGVTAINWGSNELIDDTSVVSVNWNDRTMYDNSANLSIDYTGRSLKDSSETEVLNWQTRQFNGTSSFATTASYSFATTASYLNPLNQNVVITGSLWIQNDLTVLGSASIQHISESVLNIGTNLITVNTFTPSTRFGGMSVIDSGSSPSVSASFLYDSVQDEFIFVHKGDASGAITSSHFLLGPETYNDLGNEIYLTANRIPKGTGIEHLHDSNITDTGTAVSINSNTLITGSLHITGSVSELSSSIYMTYASGSSTTKLGVPGSKFVAFTYLSDQLNIYTDKYIQISYDTSGTDPELTILTGPTSGRIQVHLFNSATAAESTIDLLTNTLTDIFSTGLLTDTRLDCTISAGSDTNWPFYKMTWFRSNTTYGGNIQVLIERFFK